MAFRPNLFRALTSKINNSAGGALSKSSNPVLRGGSQSSTFKIVEKVETGQTFIQAGNIRAKVGDTSSSLGPATIEVTLNNTDVTINNSRKTVKLSEAPKQSLPDAAILIKNQLGGLFGKKSKPRTQR